MTRAYRNAPDARDEVVIALTTTDERLMPMHATPGSAGYDLRAAVGCVVLPGETVTVPTGLRLAIPDGYDVEIRPRSGLSLKTTLRVANSPGTIDSDYRDELKIIVHNTASILDWPSVVWREPALASTLGAEGRVCTLGAWLASRGVELPALTPGLNAPVFLDEDGYPLGTVRIEAYERIAQLVVSRVVAPTFVRVDDVGAIGRNRGGGFGSTGGR